MDACLTLHAQQRAAERGIDEETIRTVASMGRLIESDDYTHTLRYKRHCLVITRDYSSIITVYKTESDKKRAKKNRQHKRRMAQINKHARKK